MGYYSDLRDCSFHIPKKNFEPAYIALMNNTEGAGWEKEPENKYKGPDDLIAFLKGDGWEEVYLDEDDPDYGICGLAISQAKSSNLEDKMRVLAPFVEDDSYIEWSGEDGAQYRWMFKNGEMIEEYAIIDYSGSQEILYAILKKKKLLPLLIGIHPSLDEMISAQLGK
jgi:hypothetical protein